MIKYTLLAILTVSYFSINAQTTPCTEIRDKTQAIIKVMNSYIAKEHISGSELQQLKTAYTGFRDYVIAKVLIDKDYDVQILLQTNALQMATHYILALERENKLNDAWDEVQFVYDNIFTKTHYQQLSNSRKDNWVACTLLAEKLKLEIFETDYKDICTDFIAAACFIAADLNKNQAALELFASNGFRGLLTDKRSLHKVAATILTDRVNNNQVDDTTFLAAYKYLVTDGKAHSILSIMSDFANFATAKALAVVINPTLADRNDAAPLNNIDEYKSTWLKYNFLFTKLMQDTSFVYKEKFDILNIAVQHYLTAIKALKKSDFGFPRLPYVSNTLDMGYDTGGEGYYGITKQMQDIVSSGNKDLLNGMTQLYDAYAENTIGNYPIIEKAHYYYSAYVCYHALGETKKADKEFNKISNSMLAKNNKGYGFKKLD